MDWRRTTAAILLCVLLCGFTPGAVGAAPSPAGSPLLELVGQVGGSTLAVAAGRDCVLAGLGPRLATFDMADPARPRLRGDILLPAPVRAIAVAGPDAPGGQVTAYVAAGTGLHVLDVSDPDRPLLLGSCSIPGEAWGICARGSLAGVATNSSGLRLIDASDPAHPREVASYVPPSGGVLSVCCLDDSSSGTGGHLYAYVIGTYGLQIFDLADPAHLALVGRCDMNSWGRAVQVAGGYVYVASDEDLQVFDVADPAHPRQVGRCNARLYAQGLVLAGQRAYVAAGYDGVRVFDIADPTHPILLAAWSAPGRTFAVAPAADGACVWVAAGPAGLRTIDISDPGNPHEVGAYENAPGYAYRVEVAGGYAYLATDDAGLRILDISDPGRPHEVADYDAFPWVHDVVVRGTYAYVAVHNGGLRVLDISDPTHPTELGSYPSSFYAAYGIDVAGNYAYIAAEEDGLWVIDVSDPTHLVRVGALPGLDTAMEIAVSGRYAFVAGAFHGLAVVDIADPVHPRYVSSCYASGFHEVRLWGGIAALAGSLSLCDVRDPQHPVALGTVRTSDEAFGLDLLGSYAYVAAGAELAVFDISDPARPTQRTYAPAPGYASGVRLVGNRAYVAAGHGGLAIYETERERAVAEVMPSGGSLVSSDGHTALQFPAGAFTRTVQVTYRHLLYDAPAPGGRLAGTGRTFELAADEPLAQPYTIALSYDPAACAPAVESTLALYSWDGAAWAREPSSHLDPATHTLTAAPDHLGLFSVLGETQRVILPIVWR